MPKTSRGTTMHPISLREVNVVRTSDLTPGMRRVTLAGPQLDAFTSDNGLDQPAFRTDGFDDEIRLVFPHPGQSEPLLPVQIEGSVRPADEGRVLSRHIPCGVGILRGVSWMWISSSTAPAWPRPGRSARNRATASTSSAREDAEPGSATAQQRAPSLGRSIP